MESLLSSFALIFVGEMGDKTQLLSLILVTRYNKPWTILSGVFVATILNHALAAGFGGWLATTVDPEMLKWILAMTFFVFAVWVLIPDKEGDAPPTKTSSVFFTTTLLFFFAEMGDKTQLVTIALGAQYTSLFLVTVGTTLGMIAANALAIFLGKSLLKRLPMLWIRRAASVAFVLFGVGIVLYR